MFVISLLHLRNYNKLSSEVQYPREFGDLKPVGSTKIALQCQNLAK